MKERVGSAPAEGAYPVPLGLEGAAAKPDEQGLSLTDLNAAFAQMLKSGSDPYEVSPEGVSEEGSADVGVLRWESEFGDEGVSSGRDADPLDDSCEISPRAILEAMLFVGSPSGEPISGERVAALMRGVRAAEIDQFARELNERYDADNCPYRVVGEKGGYRLVLREEFATAREKMLGRLRRTRLSPAAIEVLSAVAYQGPLTAEEVQKLRGAESGRLLSQLTRRQLLAVERRADAPRVALFRVTDQFLRVLGLNSLDDLPRGPDAQPK